MTPDTFLKNYKCVINAPSGLSRLREMIYALAIRGNLSQQLESDGTGHELLEDISAVKQDRIDAGTFKRSPKLESMDMIISDSIPRIPRTWAWTRLVDVGEINPRNEADDNTLAAFAPMNVISEIHNRQVRCEERPWASIKKGFTHFANGDVMVAKITPCFENGKGAVLRGLKNGIGAGTTELHVVRPLPGVLPEFIYIFLRSPHFKIVGESHMTGTAGQKRLPTEYFALRQLPLPPLEEQKRIVAKVDDLMRLCDRLEAQQQEREKLLPLLSRANHTRFVTEPTRSNLEAIFHEPGSVSPDELRQTLLNIAVNGHISLHRAGDSKPIELIEEIREIQKSSYSLRELNELKTLPAETIDSNEHCLVPLGRIARIISGQHLLPTEYHSQAEGIPYITGPAEFGRYYPDPSKWTSSKRAVALSGDILVTVKGSGVGKTNKCNLPELAISRQLMAVRPLGRVNSNYIWLCLNAATAQFQSLKTGIAIPGIGREDVMNLVIRLPSLEEQSRLVAKTDELMNYCDRLALQRLKREETQKLFALTAVNSITSTEFTENEKMKAPKTEVVTALKVSKKPKKLDAAPLTTLLSEQKNEVSAKTLWQLSGLEIDAFYRQLKTEMSNGWIDEEKDKRAIHEVEAR